MKRLVRLIAFLFLLCVLSNIDMRLNAQSSTARPAARDASAVLLVDKAIGALGGAGAIQSVNSVVITGTIQQTGNKSVATFRSVESVSGSHFEFRKETTKDSVTRVFASGNGNPGYRSTGGKAGPLSLHMVTAAPPYELPAMLLYAEKQDPAFGMTFVAATKDKPDHVQITNDADPILSAVVKQDWYFDQVTGMPLLVEYNLPSSLNALDSIRASCAYVTFKSVAGVQMPTQLLAYEEGVATAQISQSLLPTTVDSSKFTIETGSAAK